MADQEKLIADILKACDEAKSKYQLTEQRRDKLEKEFSYLVDLLKHYGVLRWTIASFFMLLGFGISGHFLSQEDIATAGTLELAVKYFAGPLIFLAGIILFRWHNHLTSLIQDYLEALGKILGHHAPEFLKPVDLKRRSERLFWGIWVVYVLAFAFLFLSRS